MRVSKSPGKDRPSQKYSTYSHYALLGALRCRRRIPDRKRLVKKTALYPTGAMAELSLRLCVCCLWFVKKRPSRPWITLNFCTNLPRSFLAGRTVDLWSCRIAFLWRHLRRRQRREGLPSRLRQRSKHAAGFGSAGRAKPARRTLSPPNGGLLDRSPTRCPTFRAV